MTSGAPGPWWTAVAGAIFGLSALVVAPLIGLEISSEFANSGGHATWLTLFAGVFLMGTLFWWLLVSRAQRFSPVRGAVTGIFVAFFSYPVVVTLSEIVYRDWHAPPPFAARLDSVMLVTGLTLMTTGFAATLSMAVVGALATWLLARFHPGAPVIAAPGAPRKWSGPRRRLAIAATVLAVFIVAGLVGSYVWLSTLPLAAPGGQTAPGQPAKSYVEATAAFRIIAAKEAGMPLHDLCRSSLLTHGRKVARVVIYFHGFTSCPAQGDALASRLFDMGYNVYRPLLFGHGEAIPTAAAMTELTSQHLIGLANESVDMAQGLGDEVVVVGLSAGGTMAAWAAQYRADVDHAIAVSPFFGPYVVPPWAMHAATNLTLSLPNLVFAWNPLQNVAEAGDFPVALPATHALAEIMLVGSLVQESARIAPPAAARVSFLLNEADVAVSNELTEAIIADWRSHGADVTVETLPFSRLLPHDVINHRERGADVELVHSTIVEMMNGPR